MKNTLLMLLSLIMIMFSTSASGASPIVGHCTSVESQFENLVSQNNYNLIQTSKARDGREVRFYYSGDDYMIAAVDKSAPKYCVQFTHAELSELLTFLIGRYDPTTSGDEGTG